MSHNNVCDDIPELILETFQRLKSHFDIPNTQPSETSHNDTIKDLKFLRNVCAKDSRIQDFIVSLPEFIELIEKLLKSDRDGLQDYFATKDGANIEGILWQFIANICVNNTTTQSIVYKKFGQEIMRNCLNRNIENITDIQLMILYNIFKGKATTFDETQSFDFIVNIWNKIHDEKTNLKLDFLHIFFEYFLTDYQWTVQLYAKMDVNKRMVALDYIKTYIQNDSPNGLVKHLLLDYISKEFKIKSDCVLKIESNFNDRVNPQEVIELLQVIAVASGCSSYTETFVKDHSLFLNVGCLLKTLTQVGQTSKNIFSPMSTLDEVAPCSNIPHDFEHEISFELKSLLIRTLANLSYKNSKNQEYAREMGFLIEILNCSKHDARNPLITEWSILAIRNLCDGCPENQDIISQMCKVGNAPNDILKDLNLELGSLRIQPNK